MATVATDKTATVGVEPLHQKRQERRWGWSPYTKRKARTTAGVEPLAEKCKKTLPDDDLLAQIDALEQSGENLMTTYLQIAGLTTTSKDAIFQIKQGVHRWSGCP